MMSYLAQTFIIYTISKIDVTLPYGHGAYFFCELKQAIQISWYLFIQNNTVDLKETIM